MLKRHHNSDGETPIPIYFSFFIPLYHQSLKYPFFPIYHFDQAGLMIYFSETHWLKTGIEVVDGIPRLACVVTNNFSDWSTQGWKELSLRIRVTQKGDGSYVVEAHMPNQMEVLEPDEGESKMEYSEQEF